MSRFREHKSHLYSHSLCCFSYLFVIWDSELEVLLNNYKNLLEVLKINNEFKNGNNFKFLRQINHPNFQTHSNNPNQMHPISQQILLNKELINEITLITNFIEKQSENFYNNSLFSWLREFLCSDRSFFYKCLEDIDIIIFDIQDSVIHSTSNFDQNQYDFYKLLETIIESNTKLLTNIINLTTLFLGKLNIINSHKKYPASSNTKQKIDKITAKFVKILMDKINLIFKNNFEINQKLAAGNHDLDPHLVQMQVNVNKNLLQLMISSICKLSSRQDWSLNCSYTDKINLLKILLTSLKSELPKSSHKSANLIFLMTNRINNTLQVICQVYAEILIGHQKNLENSEIQKQTLVNLFLFTNNNGEL